MRRLGVVVVLVLVSGCKRERTHPRLAELTSPVHVTVRTVDAPADCDALSGVDKLRCTAERVREGCTFAAVGADADLPLAYSGPMKKEHCDQLRARMNTVQLADEPLKSARLWFDPRGDRVFIHLESDGWVLFVRGGKLAGSKQLWGAGIEVPLQPVLSDGSPDWPKVPTLLATWDPTGGVIAGVTLQDVMKEDPDPQGNLTLALLGESFRYDTEGFSAGIALLDEAHRERVVVAVLDKVKAGENFSGWFRTQPALLPRYREALLVALLTNNVTNASVLNDLAQTDLARLQEVTCQLIEHEFLNPDYESEPHPPLAALTLIARRQLKCPWILPWLTRMECDAQLLCLPDDLDAAGREHRVPLCSAAKRDAAVNDAFHEETPEDMLELSGFDAGERVGELLLAAAAAQGPWPADFLLRTGRRSYEGVAPPECVDRTRPLGARLCELPPSITVSTQGTCRIKVEDAKKRLSFEVLPQ